MLSRCLPASGHRNTSESKTMDLSTALDVGLTVVSTASSVIGAGAVAAAILPKPSENAVKVYKLVRVVVDFVGANWINAKNQQS